MLNQPNIDAISAASYLDNYLDCLECLPDQIQRHISDIRRLDAQYYEGISKIHELRKEFLQICQTSSSESSSTTSSTKERKRSIMQRIKYLLAQGQITSDEKLKQISSMFEILEQKWRNLEQDGKSLDLDRSEHLLKPQSNSIVSRASPLHVSKVVDHETTNNGDNVILRSERRRMIEESHSPIVQATTSSTTTTRQGTGSSNHNKRARRQKQFPDFVRETDVVGSEPQTRRDRATAVIAAVVPSTATTSSSTTSTTNSNKRRRKMQNSGNGGATSSNGGGGSNGGGSHSNSNKSRFNVPVDPDEPTYCSCEQVSYGEMIGCDNNDCEIEWFHFNCVGLSVKPKGKWFCPNCRGDRSNIMKE